MPSWTRERDIFATTGAPTIAPSVAEAIIATIVRGASATRSALFNKKSPLDVGRVARPELGVRERVAHDAEERFERRPVREARRRIRDLRLAVLQVQRVVDAARGVDDELEELTRAVG